MPASPGTLFRRALRRVDRRSATFRALRPLAYEVGGHKHHCRECSRAWMLLLEAIRLANRLAAVSA